LSSSSPALTSASALTCPSHRRHNDGHEEEVEDDDDDQYDDDQYDDDEEEDSARNPLTIDIPPATKLIIDTVSVDPSSSSKKARESTLSLHISTDVNDFTCLIPYLSSHCNKNPHCQSMVQNLNLSLIGPNTIQLALTRNENDDSNSGNGRNNHSNNHCHQHNHDYVNIFGRIELVDEDTANAVVDAKTNHVFDELKRLQYVEEALDYENHQLNEGKKLLDDSNDNQNRKREMEEQKFLNKDIIIIKDGSSKTTTNNTFGGENNKEKKEEPNPRPMIHDYSSYAEEINNHRNKKNDTKARSNSKMSLDTTSATIENEEKKPRREKKRKLSQSESKSQGTGTIQSNDGDEQQVPVQKLTKKQRKKLAKKKAKELEEAVAKSQGHTKTGTPTTNISSVANANTNTKVSTSTSKSVSLTRQRALPCGVLVQDIIHGTGAAVRSGRKLSINYVGKFADSDVEFDKNTSASRPLTFRVGTGEVIKGLDKGMEGMKVGGERVITIPPKLGYGSKGSGNIPGNSTLCFEVKLIRIGGGSGKN